MGAPLPAQAACPHCGAAVEQVGAYCCAGCEVAARIVAGAGLERYYAERQAFAPRPTRSNAAWDAVDVVVARDGTCSADLVIDGISCASCVWLVEHLLDRSPGVADATVSYATGRARVRWDPEQTELGTLCRRIEAVGYRPRPTTVATTPDRDLLLRLGVASFVALNAMTLAAALYAGWFAGMAPRWAALFRWAELVLATPSALWCAAPFFQGAWAGLRHRVLHMDVPIAIAVTALYVHGLASTLAGQDGYLDTLTMLVAALLAGRVLEARGRRRAVEAAASLAASLPTIARRVTGDGLAQVPARDLVPGDRIVVGAGEEVAADGRIVEGNAQLAMALLTGESEPRPAGAGDPVVAGALVDEGSVVIVVDSVGAATLGARIAEQLRASVGRDPGRTPVDAIAPWFTATTLVVAALSALAWALVSGPGAGVATGVAVLVVACPCALGLSWPLAAASGLGASARRGVVLRAGASLGDLAEVDMVVLDKTGTVTEGVPRVVNAEAAALRVAAALEAHSAHPIARAIVDAAAARGIPLPRATEVREAVGAGIAGVVDGASCTVCRGGPGEVVVVQGGRNLGRIVLRDTRRDDATAAIAALRRDGTRVALLTGDHADIAHRIAREVGIDEVRADQDPEAKATWIRALREAGHTVLVVGDGVNDGPALAAADVGLAMGLHAASTVQVADGAVPYEGLGPIVSVLRVARVVRRAVRHNVARSVGYNVLAVSLAAAGLVNPLVAAVLMPLSSAMVIASSARIERHLTRLERQP